MKEEKLKEAFVKIKQDIEILSKEIKELKQQFFNTTEIMKYINEEIIQIKLDQAQEKTKEENKENYLKTIENTQNTANLSVEMTSTHPIKTSTYPVTSTDNPTHPQEIGGLKAPNLGTSTGNEGVSTDRQTDQQTVRHILRHIISRDFLPKQQKIQETQQLKQELVTTTPQKQRENVVTKEASDLPIQEQISQASNLLDSLDTLKKEIRRKFKKITRQEMTVFSTIYQLEEQKIPVDYPKLAQKLHLSESSMRDYVQRIIAKGIPILKEKLNNKKILLYISPELKKIATLDTILRLREL